MKVDDYSPNKKGSRTLRVLLVLLVALFFTGCGATSGSTPSTPNDSTRANNPATTGETSTPGNKDQFPAQTYNGPSAPVIVTRDDPSLPAGCRPRQVAEVVAGFVDAFNQGDRQQISRFLRLTGDPGPGGATPWSWYAAPEGNAERGKNRIVTYYDQDKLLAYFAERREQNERLELLMAAVIGEGQNKEVGADLSLTRTTDDLNTAPGGSQRLAQVKVVIDCGERKIIRWVMDMQKTNGRISGLRTCPRPPDWKPGTAIVACVRS